MKRIMDFFRNQYKVLIPVMVVFVLLITVYFLYREYKYDNYRNKQNAAVFQYFGGIKNEYTAIVTYNLKNVIVDVTPKDKLIEYDSTPIYYKKENKVIFPNEMSAVFPVKDGAQFRVYKYATYEFNNDNHYITNGADTNAYNYFFLFDGSGLYFFPDEVTLLIDNKEYKKLSPMSYVHVVGGYTMTYYDMENDESKVIEVEGKKISISNDYADIDLNERYCLSMNQRVLLVPPYNLNALK